MIKKKIEECKLIGKKIYLQSANAEDAEFICQLRNNKKLNAFLNNNPITTKDQLKYLDIFLKNQNNFYFIIKNTFHKSIGTVKMQILSKTTFTWGSWIIESGPLSAAIESAMLIYDFSFSEKNLSNAVFDVRKENITTISFHKKTGAILNSEDDDNFYFSLDKIQYEKFRKKYWKFIR
jgi:hypothetical protein